MTKVLAHRGFSGKFPENTMLAFDEAMQLGCHGIELDVQLTSDGTPVIIHDETLNRTTNNEASGYIAAHSYDEIKNLNAAGKFAGDGVRASIPRFTELLDLVKGTNHLLNIELKNGTCAYAGLEEAIIALLREYKMEERSVLSSFNHCSIVKCKQLAPEFKGALITSSWLFNSAAYVASTGVKGLQSKFVSLTREEIAMFKKQGITTYAWTPNTPEEIEATILLNADYMITDFPNLYHDYTKNSPHVLV